MKRMAESKPVHARILLRRTTVFLAILLAARAFAFGQTEKVSAVCSQNVFAARKPLPKLDYTCSETLREWDSRVLRLPRRRAALARVIKTLRSLTNPAWWEASVAELNACDLRGSAGQLTEEDKDRLSNYSLRLFGDRQTRLALIADPCYQVGFNGSNAFLLHRTEGRVFVTQVLNGYYSRVDDSVGVKFANLKGQRIVEVTTGNSMPPSFVSHFFVIDRAGRAIPKRIFRADGHLTNEIRSAMLLSEPQDLNLPGSATELNIIRNGKLAPSFSAYEEHPLGAIDANGRRFRRIIYRWNGRFYKAN